MGKLNRKREKPVYPPQPAEAWEENTFLSLMGGLGSQLCPLLRSAGLCSFEPSQQWKRFCAEVRRLRFL